MFSNLVNGFSKEFAFAFFFALRLTLEVEYK